LQETACKNPNRHSVAGKESPTFTEFLTQYLFEIFLDGIYNWLYSSILKFLDKGSKISPLLFQIGQLFVLFWTVKYKSVCIYIIEN
jgi:hypothetical protein